MGIRQSTVGVIVKTEIVGNKDVADGVEQVKRSVKSAQQEVSKTTTSLSDMQGKIRSALSGNTDAIDELATGFNQVGFAATAAGAAVGLAFVGAAKFALDAAMSVKDTAIAYDQLGQKVGASVEFLSKLTAAASDAEIGQETLNQGLMRFSKYIAATVGPTANLEQQLYRAADTFSKMSDGPQKAALAMEMFGKSGTALIPILNQGGAGIQALLQQMQEAGRVMTGETVAAANALDDRLDKLNGRWEVMKNSIGGGVIPALNGLFSGMDGAGKKVDELSNNLGKAADEAAASMPIFQQVGDAIFGAGEASAAAQTAVIGVGTAFAISAAAATSAAGQIAVATGEISAAVSLALRIGDQFDRFGYQFEKGAAQIAAQDYARAKAADAAAAAQRADIEELRAGALAENKAADAVDNANSSLDKQMGLLAGGAGGMRKMAEATKDAADAQDELKKRTDAINSGIGISTKQMDKMEQLQTAWKLATGQTTLEQLRQDTAMKSLMAAYDAGSLSMSDALAALVAFRNGQIDINRVFDVAGDAAKPFKDELNKLYTDMGDGLAKVQDLAAGIDKLPGAKTVELGVGVAPGTVRALDDLHERLAAIQDRTVTITVMVAGLGQLGTLFPGVGNTGSQPIGGGGTPWVDPNRGSLGNGGTPNAGTSDSPPGEGRGGVTVQNNIIVDGKTVAKSVVRNGSAPARQDKKRSYKP